MSNGTAARPKDATGLLAGYIRVQAESQEPADIFYKDWGSGKPIVLSHGWPLDADSWEAYMLFLSSNGYRTVAHDRRGNGRSTQTWSGNDMDTYADDLAAVIDALDLHDITLVGFSTGGGEVVRYLTRHGASRVAKLVLVSAIPPFMLKTPDNPDGVPIGVFDELRAQSLADRAQLYRDLADGPFYGANRNQKPSQGVRDEFWREGMASGSKNSYDCIAAFSETDLRDDLKKITLPTLVIHGDADQIVPFSVGGKASAAMIQGAELKVYPGAPHGLTETHKEQLQADLLAFAKK